MSKHPQVRQQVWVFTALLSLLPGLTDYSFFTLGTIDLLPGDAAYWNGLRGEAVAALPPFIYYLLAALMLTSLGLLAGAGKLVRGGWVLAGAALVFVEWLFPLLPGWAEWGPALLTVAQWVAFLYFIIRGKLRSWAFLVFLVFLLVFLPFSEALLFVLVAGLGRIIQVFITQNLHAFRQSSPLKVLRVTGRALLLWAPILLFAVPQIWFTRTLQDLATESIYDVGMVDRYHISEHTTLKNLDLRLGDTATYLPVLLEGEGLTADSLPLLRQNLRYALVYAFEKSDSLRTTRRVTPLFNFALSALEPGLSLSPAAAAAGDAVAQRLELVARRKTLVGVNEFQMDVELTLQNVFRETEERTAARLDSLEQIISANVEASRDSIDQNLANSTGDLKADFLAERRRIEKTTDQQFDLLERESIRTFEQTFKPRLTDISASFFSSDCGFPGIKCRAINGMKSLLRGVYAEERPKALKAVKRKAASGKAAARKKVRDELDHVQTGLFARIDQGEANIEAYADSLQIISRTTSTAVMETRDQMESTVRFLNRAVRDGLWGVQQYLFTLRLISMVAFIFLLLSSFMYVFSRVAFTAGTDLFMTLRRDDEPGVPIKPKPHGTAYTIPADHKENFYVAKKYVPTGRAPKLAIPRWRSSVGRRVATGTYFMNAIQVRQGNKEPVDFRSTAGAEFVEWTMKEGQEIVFRYEDLVAFTGGVHLQRHFSLRLTTLLVGRPFFYLAQGPGRLVLQTKGEPIISGRSAKVRSVSAERVVAWQRPVCFSVQSETNLVDIYFSSLYLQRASQEYVVIDADDGQAKRKTGLARFVLRFFLPI